MSHLNPGVWYMRSLLSERTSASHLRPLCRAKAQRSEANQVETAVRPKQLSAEKTVVSVVVTRLCGGEAQVQGG